MVQLLADDTGLTWPDSLRYTGASPPPPPPPDTLALTTIIDDQTFMQSSRMLCVCTCIPAVVQSNVIMAVHTMLCAPGQYTMPQAQKCIVLHCKAQSSAGTKMMITCIICKFQPRPQKPNCRLFVRGLAVWNRK